MAEFVRHYPDEMIEGFGFPKQYPARHGKAQIRRVSIRVVRLPFAFNAVVCIVRSNGPESSDQGLEAGEVFRLSILNPREDVSDGFLSLRGVK